MELTMDKPSAIVHAWMPKTMGAEILHKAWRMEPAIGFEPMTC